MDTKDDLIDVLPDWMQKPMDLADLGDLGLEPPFDDPEFGKLSPADERIISRLREYTEKRIAEKAQRRALSRKKEDPTAGLTKKISIRIPRPLLELVKLRAAERGVGYQTYINQVLYRTVVGSLEADS